MSDSGQPAGPASASDRLVVSGSRAVNLVTSWLRGSRFGLIVMALVVGVGSGFGSVAFRYLIQAFTWLATGNVEPLSGDVPSSHLPWLGRFFYLVIPVLGGLIYGPLIYRFAREARGHGVPEVMIAVAENGGRIRPQVTGVKAFASALCIGTGGSVGREGPIVQIGSALASSFGQLVRMSETRLRILVGCGAAGGIAATFNAPITGVFFGFELILRVFSIEALFALFLSAVVATLISRAFFGSAAFFDHFPHELTVTQLPNYLLVGVLGVLAGLVGFGFKTVLYRIEDLCDAVWGSRPEWLRPVVGGVVLGALLFALPELYGVGYGVMGDVVTRPADYAVWFVAVLLLAKMVATSLTIGIGGSGGVFAPSLFMGVMGGMAFGMVANELFGPAVGPPALYAVLGMGGVFGSAAQAPLTALASVVEMTGDFSLTVPVMLAVGIAAGLSQRLTHGTIYTTKLLRRGTDIERPTPSSVLDQLTARDAMQPMPPAPEHRHPLLPDAEQPQPLPDEPPAVSRANGMPGWERLAGPVLRSRRPQALFSDEVLRQALRQLVLYGRDGLPVISSDTYHLIGWITNADVLAAITTRLDASAVEMKQGELAAEFASARREEDLHEPRTPLRGYAIVEITVQEGTDAAGARVGELPLTQGYRVVATTHRGRTQAADSNTRLLPGDRITVLMPSQTTNGAGGSAEPPTQA